MKINNNSSKTAIIIGAGHNGLVTACYLAKAGMNVRMFERRGVAGGCCVTEELIPGFKVSSLATWFGMLRKEIIYDLDLYKFGLNDYAVDPQKLFLFKNNSFLLSTLNNEETKKYIKKIDPEGVKNWDNFWENLFSVAEILRKSLIQPAISKAQLKKDISEEGFKDISEYIFDKNAIEFVKKYFSNERVIDFIVSGAFQTRYAGVMSEGTLYNLLYDLTAQAGGVPGAWGFAEGGMGALTLALMGCAKNLGVQINLNSEVKSIITGNNIVKGIELKNGEKHYSDLVISNADAYTTFLNLLPSDSVNNLFKKKVQELDLIAASSAVHVSLSYLPKHSIDLKDDYVYSGIISINSTLEDYERNYEYSKKGLLHKFPVLTMSFPSYTDKSIAPDGKHLLSLYVQYTPYELNTGKWTEEDKKNLIQNIALSLERYFPDIKNCIEQAVVLTPYDQESIYGITLGSHDHMQMQPDQLFEERLSYETPVKNLYLCGADTHPGGTTSGACGYNCSRAIIQKYNK